MDNPAIRATRKGRRLGVTGGQVGTVHSQGGAAGVELAGLTATASEPTRDSADRGEEGIRGDCTQVSESVRKHWADTSWHSPPVNAVSEQGREGDEGARRGGRAAGAARGSGDPTIRFSRLRASLRIRSPTLSVTCRREGQAGRGSRGWGGSGRGGAEKEGGCLGPPVDEGGGCRSGLEKSGREETGCRGLGPNRLGGLKLGLGCAMLGSDEAASGETLDRGSKGQPPGIIGRRKLQGVLRHG